MGWLIAYLGVAREVADLIISVSDHSIAVMFMVMTFCIIIGTVLSPMTAVIIFLPIIQELTAVAGISDIHMALVVCLSLAVGLTTPPYGICLLIAAQIGNISMPRAFLAVLPIIGLTLLVIISVILLPNIFLFLPQAFFPQSFPAAN